MNNLLKFIKEKEGFQPNIYKCAGDKQTIGYGHVLTEYEKIIVPNTINKQQAENILSVDILNTDQLLYSIHGKKWDALEDYQRDALVSLVINWGINNYRKSKLRKFVDQGEFAKAATEFLDINKAKGKILKGLTIRRMQESMLFLNGWDAISSF